MRFALRFPGRTSMLMILSSFVTHLMIVSGNLIWTEAMEEKGLRV